MIPFSQLQGLALLSLASMLSPPAVSAQTFSCPFSSDSAISAPLNDSEIEQFTQIKNELDTLSENAETEDSSPALSERIECLNRISNRKVTSDSQISPESDTALIESEAAKVPNTAHFTDPNFKAYLDSINGYAETSNNSIKLLDTGDKHWQGLQNVIRHANRFLNLSYLEFKRDHVGFALTSALIAKRLQISKYLSNENLKSLQLYLDNPHYVISGVQDDEEIVANFLQIPGTAKGIVGLPSDLLGLPSNRTFKQGLEDLLTWYVSERLKNSGKSDSEISVILADSTQMSSTLDTMLAGSVEIRVLLDFFNVELKNLFGKEPNAMISAMKRVGIQARYAPNLLFWVSDHFKTTSSEQESIISGGNVIDKVMDLDLSDLWFRDTAFLMRGPIVSDVNQFFLSRFYPGRKYASRLAKEGSTFYEYHPDANSVSDIGQENLTARLAYTLPFKSINSLKTVLAAIRGTKNSFIMEMGFFTDPMISHELNKKARELNLRALKAANQENWKIATCDEETLAKRAHIVVIVPRYGDQLFSNISLRGIIPGMLKNGIDVCQWSGDLANQLPQAGQEPRVYIKKTMFHTKLWIADHEFAYLGSANMTHRSLWTDYELGISSVDANLIKTIESTIVKPDLDSTEPARYHVINKAFYLSSWFLNWVLWLD